MADVNYFFYGVIGSSFDMIKVLAIRGLKSFLSYQVTSA